MERTSNAHNWQLHYDNAAMESFFAALKQEQLYHRQYQTLKEAKEDIFGYIQMW